MLERALPALEGHANHFLCEDAGSGLRVEIEGLRELQSGVERSEVVIRYRNDFGIHSLAAACGFERIAIGYALRAALAQLQAEAQGMTVSHWIADEGWGVFDEANIVRVGQPMLRRLAERFGRVIVISHQAPIVAICESRLRVEADPSSGSRLIAC
jgi:DNA repair exonuclease SbcCD ATPase subunit